MALPYQASHLRRVGLRKENLGYSLLQSGPHVKVKPREQKQRSPSVDIDAPPRDSSDDASTVHDVDLSETESLPSKKRKTETYELAFKSTDSKSPQSGSDDAVSELANEPSRFPSSSFTSSNGRSRRLNGSRTNFKGPSQAARVAATDAVEDPIDTWTAKPKKSKVMYGVNPRNIHTALSPRKKKDMEGSISAVEKSKTGFRIFNDKAVEPLR